MQEAGDRYNAGLLDLSRKAVVISMAMDDADLVAWALGLYRKYKADFATREESKDDAG